MKARMSREELGRLVRKTWILWCYSQKTPEKYDLMPYDNLSPEEKELNCRIGEALKVAVEIEILDRITSIANEKFSGSEKEHPTNVLDELYRTLLQ